jgi:hypothetical protein
MNDNRLPKNILSYKTEGINNERPTGQKQQLLYGTTEENEGKLILPEIFPSVKKRDI